MVIGGKTPDADTPRCWNCLNCADLGGHSECRAAPPTVDTDGDAIWPGVRKWDWCRAWTDFRQEAPVPVAAI